MRESIDLSSNANEQEAFWRSLAGRIFAVLPKPGTKTAIDPGDDLTALGISESFLQAVGEAVGPETSAVILACEAGDRERITGLLRGFGARLARTHLPGNDPQAWLATLHQR